MLDFLSTSIVRRFNAVILTVITVGLLIFALFIGFYNYNTTIDALENKAQNMAKLSAISLENPIWNIDDVGIENIVTAILSDKDVIAVKIVAADEPEQSMIEKQRGVGKNIAFDAMKTNRNMIYMLGNVVKEEEKIGEVHIVISTNKAYELIQYTSLMIFGFTLSMIVLIGGIVSYTARRVIQSPILELEQSAHELAKGNLAHKIHTHRKDELGNLARSFAKMRDAIRKKIADLGVLNTTGESLASLHKESDVLKTVLRVFKDQIGVDQGEVYLLSEGELCFSASDSEIELPKEKRILLGEGIIGRVAEKKQLIYVKDTNQDSNYVSSEEERGKSLLCIPMLDGTELFGVMNFSGAKEKIVFAKEDIEFAETLARLTVVTLKNTKMIAVIEEQNRTLEHKVEERTKELREKSNDIQNMLQNMQQGICTILDDNSIHQEYSIFLEEILETKRIAGENVIQLFLENSNLGADAINQIEVALQSLPGSDLLMYECNSHLFLKEVTKTLDDGRQKILELDWTPIVNDMDEIEKMMLTVRDVTQLRDLQAEAQKQKEELEIVGQILSISKKKFQDFVNTSQQFLDENEKIINSSEKPSIHILETLFRNIHTIKGNARTYGFSNLTDVIHLVENTYDQLRRTKKLEWNKEALLTELQNAEKSISQYASIFQSKISDHSNEDGVFIDYKLLDMIKQIVEKAKKVKLQADTQLIDRIENTIQAIGTEPLDSILEGIIKAIPQLAQDLGKAVPKLQIRDNNIRFNSEILPVLKDVFMHIFRNSMDHGLEVAKERVEQGKPEEGTFSLELSKKDAKVFFEFKDDGRGLALDRLYQKAVESGSFENKKSVSDVEIAELIFQSGLSTTESVTDISGRGVGMDAVRRFLENNGGGIKVEFIGKKVNGFRPFQFKIFLPETVAIQI